MVKNLRTGVSFPWTPILHNLAHMSEIPASQVTDLPGSLQSVPLEKLVEYAEDMQRSRDQWRACALKWEATWAPCQTLCDDLARRYGQDYYSRPDGTYPERIMAYLTAAENRADAEMRRSAAAEAQAKVSAAALVCARAELTETKAFGVDCERRLKFVSRIACVALAGLAVMSILFAIAAST